MERRRILRYLPENYQLAAANEYGVLSACLAVMEGMHAPDDRILRSLDQYFDPYRAIEPFILLQASWLGLDRYFEWSGINIGAGEASFPTGTDRLRLLITEFPSLVKDRGTRASLTRFLEVATGIDGFVIDDGGSSGKSFHFVVHAPETARPLRRFVEKIVAEERPAHATFEIEFADGTSALTDAEVSTPRKRRRNAPKRPKSRSRTKRTSAPKRAPVQTPQRPRKSLRKE